MARARNIKPSFFTSEQVGDNDPLGRLLFIGLWTVADYKGDLEWKPRTLKVQLLPWDDCDIVALAINLDKSGLIRFYSVGERTYVNILNFDKHQNPHKNEREKGSEIPRFTDAMRQAVDLEGLAINRDKSGSIRIGSESDRADSPFLIPDSLIPPAAPLERADADSRPRKSRFEKPTVDDLFAEFNGRVPSPRAEAEKFLAYYESNGWKIGKNPMKSWKHTVTTWVTRRHENGQVSGGSYQRYPTAAERTQAAFDAVFGPSAGGAFEGVFTEVDELEDDPGSDAGGSARLVVRPA